MPNAIRIHQTGGPEVLQWESVAVLEPGPGEARVRHTAVGLNYIDTYHRSGLYSLPMPSGLGSEAAGVVEEVGPGVTGLKPGDRVAYAGGPIGAYADERVIPADRLVPVPAAITDQQAAAMMLKGMTAWYLVRRTHPVKRGETILIQGGAGGVAGFAIQLAKHIGATVVTTASARNHDYVRSLGAERIIDYQKEDFTKAVSGCDVVFDTVGGEVQVRSYEVLKPGGRLVWIAPAPAGFQPPRSDVELLRPRVARDRAHLERMKELYEAGAVWPPAITRYPLAEAAEAHRISEGRHLQGKLVLMVR